MDRVGRVQRVASELGPARESILLLRHQARVAQRRGYIIAHVLRLLSIKPLTAARYERPSAVNFLLGLAARSVFLFAATVGLNLIVNPLGVHGSRLFEPIALSTRGTKLYLYEQTRPPPAIVILGSSRSFSMDPQYIKAKTSRNAFNAAAAAAGIRDYLDLAQCFAARGSFPSLLIVGVGVEQALAEGHTFERDDRLADCLHPQRTLSDRVLTYRGLFTPEETWASLRVLRLELTGRPAPAYLFLNDGMLRGFGSPPPRVLEQSVNDSLAGAWGPGNFADDSLSHKSVSQIRQLLDLCRDHGAKVIVYLPPYHPRAVTRYLKESQFASARSQLLKQLAAWATEYPLRFYDFTEVSRFGGSEEMFGDASHPTADANRLMLDIMLADET